MIHAGVILSDDEGVPIYLKDLPKNVDVCELVELVMIMTQTALLRVYEVVEFEKRPLTNDERSSLDELIKFFDIAKRDTRGLKRKMLN